MERFSELDKQNKLLIIHADDVGLCHSANKATFHGMQNGLINSASIMVNCPFFSDARDFFCDNPELDVGIHITLTNEWPSYKWRPITTKENPSSLVDANGYLGSLELLWNAKLCEVEREVRQQIELGLNSGLCISHIDCHMFCLYSKPQLFELYVRMGKEYNLPIMANKTYARYSGFNIDNYLETDALRIDRIYMAKPINATGGLTTYYDNVIENMKTGLNVLLIHPAENNTELQAITQGIVPWGAEWRQTDYDYFCDPGTKEKLLAQGIKLVSWRDIHKHFIHTAQ